MRRHAGPGKSLSVQPPSTEATVARAIDVAALAEAELARWFRAGAKALRADLTGHAAVAGCTRTVATVPAMRMVVFRLKLGA